MPLYDYTCQTCDHTFEKLVRNSEPVECPECHGDKVERLLSVPAKPQTGGRSLPTACNPNLPPCGPGCCRL